MCVPAVLLIGD